MFREKAATLAAALEHDDQHDAARQALRGFLDRIVIPPGAGLLQVVGNFGAMLATAEGRKAGLASGVGYVGCGGPQPSLPTTSSSPLPSTWWRHEAPRRGREIRVRAFRSACTVHKLDPVRPRARTHATARRDGRGGLWPEFASQSTFQSPVAPW
jgi:hypothetical protein